MKRGLIGLALAAALAIPFAAQAKGHGKGHWGRGLASLDLQPEQRERIKAMRAEMAERAAPVREMVKAKKAELRTLWMADAPDRNAILAKQEEILRLRRELRVARVDHRLALLQVLTPEQRAELIKRMEDGPKQRRHGKHGRGFGPGDGAGECRMGT
ncbi:MAG: Spy/CpxP family protein refolding chaperone [Myxococcales bacterium]|jgi:Spy/CpxP family protein refolding chaperone